MANSQRLTTVRLAIEGYLASQSDQPGSQTKLELVSSQDGVSSETLASGDDEIGIDCVIASESILIRDEHYCGLRFNTSTHRAVWFIEEDQVKIYTADQRLLCVLTADEIDAAADAATDEAVIDQPHVISINSKRVDSADRDLGNADEEIRRAA